MRLAFKSYRCRRRWLGFLVMDAATFFRVPDVYIGIIIIGLIGLTLEAITRAVERSLLHWQGR